jgi:nucleoside-diphosphate-sugar epimerase
VPLLLARGHQVTVLTRSAAKAEALRREEEAALMADAFDAHAVSSAVLEVRPEVVVHELTAL